MSSLRTCFKSLKEINDLLFKFLWEGKRNKVKRSEMMADYGNRNLKKFGHHGFQQQSLEFQEIWQK